MVMLVVQFSSHKTAAFFSCSLVLSVSFLLLKERHYVGVALSKREPGRQAAAEGACLQEHSGRGTESEAIARRRVAASGALRAVKTLTNIKVPASFAAAFRQYTFANIKVLPLRTRMLEELTCWWGFEMCASHGRNWSHPTLNSWQPAPSTYSRTKRSFLGLSHAGCLILLKLRTGDVPGLRHKSGIPLQSGSLLRREMFAVVTRGRLLG